MIRRYEPLFPSMCQQVKFSKKKLFNVGKLCLNMSCQ